MIAELKNTSIAIDLTPLLPGGDNGGAKLMTLELLKHLFALHSTTRFLLITAEHNHDELAHLESDHVKRIKHTPHARTFSGTKWAIGLILPMLPYVVLKGLKIVLKPLVNYFRTEDLLKKHPIDLLFCPFTAPTFATNQTPVVSVIYDLQHKTYPQFFTSHEFQHRETFFKYAFLKADQLICISEYVRQTVIKQKEVVEKRVHTIPIQLSSRLPQIDEKSKCHLIARLRISERRFLFFPANFWPHKNHQMLFTAFSMYKAAHPTSDLKLVCSGAPGEQMKQLQLACKKMGLKDEIVFPGYVSHEELAVLMGCCQALIFPSLYEGFGMPIMEAMTLGTPVLCSKCTSLPEIAADAAIYFDPKCPSTIINAIELVESNPSSLQELIRRGTERATLYSDAKKMAREYSQIFQLAIRKT